jgi:hypothetical protein
LRVTPNVTVCVAEYPDADFAHCNPSGCVLVRDIASGRIKFAVRWMNAFAFLSEDGAVGPQQLRCRQSPLPDGRMVVTMVIVTGPL